jgi:hypothetical protein
MAALYRRAAEGFVQTRAMTAHRRRDTTSVFGDTSAMDFDSQPLSGSNERTVQTVEVPVERLPGDRLDPADFAGRLLALCTAMGIEASLYGAGTGVEFEPGLEDADDELTQGLVRLLEARFLI